jgi:hypothetical protein
VVQLAALSTLDAGSNRLEDLSVQADRVATCAERQPVQVDAGAYLDRPQKKVLPPTVSEDTSGGRTFVEPIPLSFTDPADFRLPATASAIGFDLVAFRTRRTREPRDCRGEIQGFAETNSPLFASIRFLPQGR